MKKLTSIAVAAALITAVGCGKDESKAEQQRLEAAMARDKASAAKEIAKRKADRKAGKGPAAAGDPVAKLAKMTAGRAGGAAFVTMMTTTTAPYLELMYASALKGGKLGDADRKWLGERLKALTAERLEPALRKAIGGYFSKQEAAAIVDRRKHAGAARKMPGWGKALSGTMNAFKRDMRRAVRGEYGRKLPGDEGAKIAAALDLADDFVDARSGDKLQAELVLNTRVALRKAGVDLTLGQSSALNTKAAAAVGGLRPAVNAAALKAALAGKRADFEGDGAAKKHEPVHAAAYSQWMQATSARLAAGFAPKPAAAAGATIGNAKSPAAAKAFAMKVEGAFFIKGLGLIATGKVAAGKVSPGAELVLVHGGKKRKVKVKSVEANRKAIAKAFPGANVGLTLEGLAKGDVARGDKLIGK